MGCEGIWCSWACPLTPLDLGLDLGTGPNFVMEIGFRLAHEDFGLRFELQLRPNLVFSFGFGLGLVD